MSRATYVDVTQLDDPAGFINLVDIFKRTYYWYGVKKMDEKKLLAIVNKFGMKHVLYTLNRLSDEHIPDDDREHPYAHLERVTRNMVRAYQRKVNASRSGSDGGSLHKYQTEL